MFSTPEYAARCPGSFLNLLDWTIGGGRDLREARRVDQRRDVADRRGQGLRVAAHRPGYAGTRIIDSACAHIPVLHADVGEDGLVADPAARRQVADVVATLVKELDQ